MSPIIEDLEIGTKRRGCQFIENKRCYDKQIQTAVQKAHTEFAYPSSSVSVGLKEMMPREFLMQTIEDEIFFSKIPKNLKIKIIGKSKYNDIRLARG